MSKHLNIWYIYILDYGEWYYVFAYSEKAALRIIAKTHYDITLREFCETYKPTVRRVPDDEIISVIDEDLGLIKQAAKQWAKNAKSGPFCSNTYEH